jgi:hypothetical protein
MYLRVSKRYTGVIEAFKPGADVDLCHWGAGTGHGLRFENVEQASIQASDAMHDSDSREAAFCLRLFIFARLFIAHTTYLLTEGYGELLVLLER